ncbi:MAG: hypothetical protein AT715_04145 [Thermoproteus sp. JCHS_4]|jgi:hypothetical protein|nr:MAG: hypothetical protein AT715_04145 [Thermoproteus sp. JCHS_4]
MDRRKLGLLGFAAIALAAISLAALQFTNVTYWSVNATLPPAMKYAGADTGITGRNDGSGYHNYIYVTYSYDSSGLNKTMISIVGFTGDVTNYTNALQVCNYHYNGPLTVSIKYIGPVGGANTSDVRQFVVYDPKNQGQWVGFNSKGSTNPGPVTFGTIQQNQCITLGVSVLVDPSAYSTNTANNLANGKTVLATYEVDIMFSTT